MLAVLFKKVYLKILIYFALLPIILMLIYVLDKYLLAGYYNAVFFIMCVFTIFVLLGLYNILNELIYISITYEEIKYLKGLLFHTYFSVVLIFSSIFFSIQFISDWVDSHMQSSLINRKIACFTCTILDENDFDKFEFENYRGLRGIEARLWSSPNYPDTTANKSLGNEYFLYKMRGERYISNKTAIKLYKEKGYRGIYQPVFFSENIGSVFLDCFYFSMITIATIGYGDIVPNIWITKFFVIIEIFIGIFITIYAFGRYFYLLSKG